MGSRACFLVCTFFLRVMCRWRTDFLGVRQLCSGYVREILDWFNTYLSYLCIFKWLLVTCDAEGAVARAFVKINFRVYEGGRSL